MNRELILEKIKALAAEAEASGEMLIAGTLWTLAGSIYACHEKDLFEHVVKFSQAEVMGMEAVRN